MCCGSFHYPFIPVNLGPSCTPGPAPCLAPRCDAAGCGPLLSCRQPHRPFHGRSLVCICARFAFRCHHIGEAQGRRSFTGQQWVVTDELRGDTLPKWAQAIAMQDVEGLQQLRCRAWCGASASASRCTCAQMGVGVRSPRPPSLAPAPGGCSRGPQSISSNAQASFNDWPSLSPDLGIGLEAEPGRDGPVLLGLLGQLPLGGERLLRRLQQG